MLEKRWLIFNFLHPSYQFSLLLPEFVQTGQVQFFMNVTVLLQFMTRTFPCFQFSIVLLILSPLTFLVEKMVKSGGLPFFLLPCAQSLVKK